MAQYIQSTSTVQLSIDAVLLCNIRVDFPAQKHRTGVQ